MFRLLITLCLYASFMATAYSGDTFSIRYESSGFFNYDRNLGDVVFVERKFSRASAGAPGVGRNFVYRINLNDRKVIESVGFRDAAARCLGYMPKRSPGGAYLASLSLSGKAVLLLDLVSGECREVVAGFYHSDYSWSEDGKKLIFKDASTNSFHVLDPRTQQFERYSSAGGGVAYSVSWSQMLNETIYIFKPRELSEVEPYKYTTDDFDYFYINDEGEWVRLEVKHPLMNPHGDVYFVEHSGIEQLPTTEFFDAETGDMLSIQENFFVAGGNNKYAVWLDNDWVYFQGGAGVLNYRSGQFVPFGSDEDPLVPFSVADGRYAIMYDGKEGLLKVYDLQTRKYIESYEPFWRDSYSSNP